MRKIFAVIFVFILAGSAFGLDLFPYDKENINPVDVKFEDGLHIEFLGAYVNNRDGNVHSLFMLTSDTDMSVTVFADRLFDDKGGRFFPTDVRMAGYHVSKIDMAANVPMIVLFEYQSVYDKNLRGVNARSIANVKYYFNDHELEFEGIKMQKWAVALEKIKRLGFNKREWFSRE